MDEPRGAHGRENGRKTRRGIRRRVTACFDMLGPVEARRECAGLLSRVARVRLRDARALRETQVRRAPIRNKNAMFHVEHFSFPASAGKRAMFHVEHFSISHEKTQVVQSAYNDSRGLTARILRSQCFTSQHEPSQQTYDRGNAGGSGALRRSRRRCCARLATAEDHHRRRATRLAVDDELPSRDPCDARDRHAT